MERTFGVHSEVGKLRTVMVCRPGLAHQRLTPGNCHALLFDDVLWVQEAQKDHYDFVLKLQSRGAEVLELHDLLATTLDDPEARSWILDRRITANSVGLVVTRAVRPWLDAMPAKQLADHLIGQLLSRHRIEPWADSASDNQPNAIGGNAPVEDPRACLGIV